MSNDLLNHIHAGGPLLEALQATRDSLENRPYHFAEWTECTCGHIYKGAIGRKASNLNHVATSSNVTYGQVMKYIVEANGWNLEPLDIENGECAYCGKDISTADRKIGHCISCLAGTVSNETANMVGRRVTDDEEFRKAAVKIIDVAIAQCKKDTIAAMQGVADEAERIVIADSITADIETMREKALA